MIDRLREQAQKAFHSVREESNPHTSRETFRLLVDLDLALLELGEAAGCPLTLKSADTAIVAEPVKMMWDWDVVSYEDGENSPTFIAHLRYHSEDGQLYFYSDPAKPNSGMPLIGNEAELFKKVIQHLQSVTKANVWERDCAPALERLLSGPAAP